MRLAVINIVGLSRSLIGPHTPALAAFAERAGLQSHRPAFPAVTCTAQSSIVTGTPPAGHGIVGNGWYDRAEGALTDAALFLHDNKRAYDLTKPGHRAEFAETKRELCRVYDALAVQKGSASMKLRAAALRAGLGVFAMYVRARG